MTTVFINNYFELELDKSYSLSAQVTGRRMSLNVQVKYGLESD